MGVCNFGLCVCTSGGRWRGGLATKVVLFVKRRSTRYKYRDKFGKFKSSREGIVDTTVATRGTSESRRRLCDFDDNEGWTRLSR